jgi:Protein of unknown function (DUF2934)
MESERLENRIRERAYEIWTAQSCVHGQTDQHWPCGRAGNRGGIDGRACPRKGAAKKAPIACSFEERQNA